MQDTLFTLISTCKIVKIENLIQEIFPWSPFKVQDKEDNDEEITDEQDIQISVENDSGWTAAALQCCQDKIVQGLRNILR